MIDDEKIKQAAREVLDGFFACPTDQPLIIERVGNAVVFSRGIMKRRMTRKEAAEYLGIDRKTLQNKYIATRKLRVGTDGRIGRETLHRFVESLDGRGV